MASRGKNETEILKSNLFSQLDRLIVQLHDCEQLKLVQILGLKIYFIIKCFLFLIKR
jgi:hypothetical protein